MPIRYLLWDTVLELAGHKGLLHRADKLHQHHDVQNWAVIRATEIFRKVAKITFVRLIAFIFIEKYLSPKTT